MIPSLVTEARVEHLKDKLARVKEQMGTLRQIAQQLNESPDQQVSLTDPDARSMATSGRGTGIVGYNVQTAVDTKHHLIVAHEVTNVGHDRTQLADMAEQAKAVIGQPITALADRGYFKGEEILRCADNGIEPLVPKPLTSNNKADGSVRQERLRLHRGRRHLPLPGGRARHPPHDGGRERHDAAQVLVIGLSGDARSSPSARPAWSVGSRAGNTRRCSNECRRG